jgi:hypothetical protein
MISRKEMDGWAVFQIILFIIPVFNIHLCRYLQYEIAQPAAAKAILLKLINSVKASK